MKKTLNIIFICVTVFSCTDFIEIDPPATDLVKSTVFSSEKTATAAILDIYSQMANNGFASGDLFSITYVTSLSSDEVVNFNMGAGAGQMLSRFNENSLTPDNMLITALWSELYKTIHKANLIIEGVESSKELSLEVKMQLIGEARFLRAFCHFYLVNLWGDIPLVTVTDYRINQSIPRTSRPIVYQQIIDDLTSARSWLLEDYAISNNERVRPNSSAASALLARAYLYAENWQNAEAEASKVINNTLYNLPMDLNAVFAKNGPEAIWQLHSLYPAKDAFTFLLTPSSRKNALRDEIVNGFDAVDQRKQNWIGSIADATDTLYFARKYKGINYADVSEYTTILRLSEQYLIRAEARLHLKDIMGASEDLNTVRARAGLEATSFTDEDSLLDAIHEERLHEFFTEWGHRWMDLKRSGRVDAVLSPLKPAWKSEAALYPIPETQILNDIAMKDAQNPGY